MTARRVVAAMVSLAAAGCGAETVPEPGGTTQPPTSLGVPVVTETVVVAPTTTATVVLETPETTLPTLVLPEHAHDDLTDDQWAADPPPPPSPQGRTARQDGDGPWEALAECESGGTNADTGNGYGGYFQFSPSTWASLDTGYASAVDAPYAVQLDAAQRLQARSGWGQWPDCSSRLGLR